jgi:hypothetical protein
MLLFYSAGELRKHRSLHEMHRALGDFPRRSQRSLRLYVAVSEHGYKNIGHSKFVAQWYIRLTSAYRFSELYFYVM